MSGYVRHIALENFVNRLFLKTKNVRVGPADCRGSRTAGKPRRGRPTACAVGKPASLQHRKSCDVERAKLPFLDATQVVKKRLSDK